MNNVVSQASLGTRARVWWDGIPIVTRSIFAVCVGIWAASLLTGWDNLAAVCLSPADVVSRLQLYRIVTAALFHAGLLHVALNMMAFLPLGASLERTMGSLHLLWLVLLLAFLGDAAYVAIAYAAAAAQLPAFLTQCAVGFSGVLFGLIVIDSNASGAAQRSIFGIVMVPTGAYPWALLVLWQMVVPQASFLGHLSGLMIGQMFVLGWLRWMLPSAAATQRVERSALLSWCTQSPSYIVHTGGSVGAASSVLPVSRPAGNTSSEGSGGSAAMSWLRGVWMAAVARAQPLHEQEHHQHAYTPFVPPAAGGDSGRSQQASGAVVGGAQSQHAGGGAVVGGAPSQSDPKAAAAAAAEARAKAKALSFPAGNRN